MNNEYMKYAVMLANKAYKSQNVPVGAVIVKDNKIISCGYNKKNSKNISLLHAEIIAIYKACKKFNRWILDDCDIYVTMKPCNMCYYALAETRIRNVYYIMNSEYEKNLEKNGNYINFHKCNDEFDYNLIVNNFFKNLRNK